MSDDLRERLYSRAVIDPETGCLLWQGYLNHGGYGMIRAGHRPWMVHRIAWELENGPIPDGLFIDHVYERGCRHRNCVNVAHLEPVTVAENNRRAMESHTHCRRGHEYAGNTRIYGGKRHCMPCKRIREGRRPITP